MRIEYLAGTHSRVPSPRNTITPEVPLFLTAYPKVAWDRPATNYGCDMASILPESVCLG